MAIRITRWGLASISLVALSMAAACGPVTLPLLTQSDDPSVGQSAAVVAQAAAGATPTPAKTRLTGPQPVAVKRDTLTETLSLEGTVLAQSQEPVVSEARGSVDSIRVKVGQAVAQGDILVDFDAVEITRSLDAARVSLQTSETNLVQAQTQTAARQAAVAQQAALDQQRQQQAILDAQAGLRRAQDNLALVRAGRTNGVAAERQAQQTTVAAAQAEVQRAQRTLDTLTAGPDEDAVRAARREVTNDEIALTRAKADLDTLTKGPDPVALRAAQATIQRAQTQLQVAQAAKVDPRAADPVVARIQIDGAIQDAQVALLNAQNQATKLKEPPAEVDVLAARQRIQDAQDTLTTATARQDALESGPTEATLGAAQAAVDQARRALAQAQTGLDLVNSHPTPAELADAQEQVRKAQVAVDNATQDPASILDGGGADVAGWQRVVSQAEKMVATWETTLEATHLRAPFDGTVVAVRTKPGDLVTPSKPVIILARNGPPIVRVDLDEAQAKQLGVGQPAAIQLGTDASASARLVATITGITRATPDGSTGASANLAVRWVDGQLPKFGTPVVAMVTLQQKQDILVVPKTAVRQSGGRATVLVQDGSFRRLVNVQVGITTDASVEILSGLSEGQMVLAVSS